MVSDHSYFDSPRNTNPYAKTAPALRGVRCGLLKNAMRFAHETEIYASPHTWRLASRFAALVSTIRPCFRKIA